MNAIFGMMGSIIFMGLMNVISRQSDMEISRFVWVNIGMFVSLSVIWFSGFLTGANKL